MPATTILSREFADRLFHKLSAVQTDANLFLSPFSIQVALAMCAVGARGETRNALAALIGASDSIEEQNEQYGALLRSINDDGTRPFELVSANALWGQRGFGFKADFQEAIADFY